MPTIEAPKVVTQVKHIEESIKPDGSQSGSKTNEKDQTKLFLIGIATSASILLLGIIVDYYRNRG